MGFLGLLSFALTFFHLLAWPLFALGYPLCTSVRAIEANSNYHLRKLVTYWILFSMISLFELALAKLIDWIPLWPYMKLGIICWLVLSRFEGAYYCYTSFIQPCLYVDLEQVMDRLYKRLKTLVEKENFLSVAERYINENGTEALEKLIARKLNQKDSRTDFGGEKIKAVTESEKKEMPQIVKDSGTQFDVENTKAVAEVEKKEMPEIVKGSRTDFGFEEIKTVAEAEKNEMREMAKSNGNDFKVDHNDINRVELPERKASVLEISVPIPTASKEEVLPEKAPFEKWQKEWTCAVCQVTTTCEANLNSHFTGRKHRAKCDELKSKSTKQNADNTSNSETKQLKSDCAKTCMSETDFVSHRNVKKHWARVQERVPEVAINLAGVLGRDYSAVSYNYDSDLSVS